eukprot:CAMPEP_0201552854 /NCGR_PEP_ID=MMETSP0173_2-20130828/18664_1 /ASSEMBLY_ACC=CAM_ASM_000268 /TAXON_ID=218659 /ORGANISM="Vexillifera sp., Strain DIVA3 564/2" /LENGTH=277 /DNA_ID=CAMNT_0047963415 /DNA_START=27 /DNA_END=860 /DNA_ORIENTATION=+
MSSSGTGLSKKPQTPIPNDPFDRQRCIEGWDQDLMEKQCAFVLGVGGLGCGIAMTLARLGIGKMILLDFDTVDVTNLNRQLLFDKSHVGKKKVEAGAEGLKAHLVGDTKIEVMHMNVLSEWGKVVEKAKECTVIFNNIDIGGYFDYAVIALAKSLGNVPVGAGSSYARTWVAEYFSGAKDDSSFSFVNADGDKSIFEKLSPDKIQSYKDLSFLPKDDTPPTRNIGSNALVCTCASVMTVNAWVQSLFGEEMPNYTKFDMVSFKKPGDTLTWGHEMFR